MGGQEIANGVPPSPDNEGRMLARAKEHLIVEQKNPILVACNDRLHQDRVVILRDLAEVSNQRGLVVHGLREIAARSRQRFDEGRAAQVSKNAQRVLALVPGWAMGAMPVMQKEIFAAERRHAGLRQNPAGEIFVGGQRRGGGVVLRIP